MLLDEAEKALRLEQRQKMFKEYRVTRNAMLQVRHKDREQRNKAKLKQLEIAEDWQVRSKYQLPCICATVYTPMKHVACIRVYYVVSGLVLASCYVTLQMSNLNVT